MPIRGEAMSPSNWKPRSQLLLIWLVTLAFIFGRTVLSAQPGAQPQSYSENSSDGLGNTVAVESPEMVYIAPTQSTKLKTYVFDAFGPYALASGAEARAMVIREYLVENFGFDDSQLKTLGLGKQAASDINAEWGSVQIVVFPAGTEVPGATGAKGSTSITDAALPIPVRASATQKP
jgi:hypothetical protein